MLKTLWTFLFGLKAKPLPEEPSLRRRVADLEGDLAYLAGDFEKLRGRVTGYIRKQRHEAPRDEPDEVEPTRLEEPTPSTNGPTAHLSRRFRRF